MGAWGRRRLRGWTSSSVTLQIGAQSEFRALFGGQGRAGPLPAPGSPLLWHSQKHSTKRISVQPPPDRAAAGRAWPLVPTVCTELTPLPLTELVTPGATVPALQMRERRWREARLTCDGSLCYPDAHRQCQACLHCITEGEDLGRSLGPPLWAASMALWGSSSTRRFTYQSLRISVATGGSVAQNRPKERARQVSSQSLL